jgi:ABC-2 type transport system ATP-binding protein
MELGCLVESASLADLYHRLGHQQLVIATQRDRAALIAAIRDHPQVKHWELESDERALRVDFSGNPDDAAALLRQLIAQGLPISTFTPTQDTLESLFFKLGHQQVS